MKTETLNLKTLIERVYIVKYCEDTTLLEQSILAAGFECLIVDKKYSAVEMEYSSIARGLLTHTEAWSRIYHDGEPALVVEADFVPCLGFENFPLPHRDPSQVWCWLYTGTSVAYELQSGYMRGHAASPVATLIYPGLAKALLDFSSDQLQSKDVQEYLPWDSYVDYYVRERGWDVYLAYRSFGEHGGVPDPAHRAFGLNKTHRADCLYNKLAFLPDYAENSTLKFVRERCIAKIKAVLKVFLLRRVDKGSFYSLLAKPSELIKFFGYEFKRLMTIY